MCILSYEPKDSNITLSKGGVQSEIRKWIIPRCRTIVSLIVEGLISEIVWLELVHETSKCKWNLRGKPAQCLLASRSRSVDLSGLDRIKSFCNRRFQLPPVTCLRKSCCQWREAIVRYLWRFELNYKPLCIFLKIYEDRPLRRCGSDLSLKNCRIQRFFIFQKWQYTADERTCSLESKGILSQVLGVHTEAWNSQ